MLHARCEDEHVSGVQGVVLAQCVEENLALQDMYADRAVGTMSGKISARSYGHHGESKRSFLHQGACGAPVPGKEDGVDHPLVLRQMMDQDFSRYSAMHR